MATPIAIIFKALADPTRQRLVQVLCRQELSVSELVDVLGLPQSTVSRHLKVLREAGLVLDRRVGATVLQAALPVGALTDAELHTNATAASNGHSGIDLRERLMEWARHEPLDRRTQDRVESALRRRRSDHEDFFERMGTRWDQMRIEAFGEAFHLEALTALLPDEWTVADIGSGTGYLLPVLASRFERVIAVEPVGAMLEAARNRPELKTAHNVEFREGALARLPLDAGEVDLAIASLVLHHVAVPEAAIQELRRVIRPNGRLLMIEQHEHANDEFHERMGDYWRGFAPARLEAWVRDSAFTDVRISVLTQARSCGRQTGEVPALYVLAARAR